MVDAINIDLKCFREEGYRRLGGRLAPVLDAIRRWHGEGKWVELTTLVVPGFNDSDEELEQIIDFIAGLDVNIPWHVSAYFSAYRMPAEPGPRHRAAADRSRTRAPGRLRSCIPAMSAALTPTTTPSAQAAA